MGGAVWWECGGLVGGLGWRGPTKDDRMEVAETDARGGRIEVVKADASTLAVEKFGRAEADTSMPVVEKIGHGPRRPG